MRRVGEWPRRRLEMRVRWAGVDPATHLPWADAWRPMTDGSGAVANSALNKEARRMEAQRYGMRLVMPAPPPPPRARRLNVRLRCEDDDGDEDGGDAVRPPRRPRRPGAVIGEEPGTADGGCARAMQRGSQKETSRCEGSACEPGRAGAGTGNGGGEAPGDAAGGDGRRTERHAATSTAARQIS